MSGAYALGSGAAGVSESVADGKVVTLAALDDLEDGVGLCNNDSRHVCGEAVALQQCLGNCLQSRNEVTGVALVKWQILPLTT